jgi:hypothetical protein
LRTDKKNQLVANLLHFYEANFPKRSYCTRPHRAADAARARRRGDRITWPISEFGTSRTSGDVRPKSAKWAEPDIDQVAVTNRDFMSTCPNAQVGGPLRGQTGKHLLVLSFTGFDPERSYALVHYGIQINARQRSNNISHSTRVDVCAFGLVAAVTRNPQRR